MHRSQKLLLAVSGGVDSVVLCDLCKASGYDFAIAHCNFQLRGADSERDEQFVATLAKQYNVPFFVKRFDTTVIAQEQKKAIEETARNLRYAWFAELLSNEKYDLLLTAHHANDNIETVLMNFFRGTGVRGLRGILPKHNKIVRPLLFAGKEDLAQYATEKKLTYVEDYTNAENDYTRNYFRNELIPSIAKVFPNVAGNILQNIERFTEIEQLYTASIEEWKSRSVEKKGNELHIPILKIKKYSSVTTIIWELIRDFGFTAAQAYDVQQLLDSETGKYVDSPTHRVLKNRKWLIIAPLSGKENSVIVIEEAVPSVHTGEATLYFEIVPAENMKFSSDNTVAYLDANAIGYPLLLRRWKTGDYFYPLGMVKKKKLSRFFIDSKMSVIEKEKTLVLEMNKKIVWVVGKRIDDRFKITPTTKQILKITLTQPK